MATLLLRLEGPMQSWGTRSGFDLRDSEMEPSKSGVLGLLCAALGVDRDDWEGLKPLTELAMGVRVDRAGVLKSDYQTAQLHPQKPDSSTALSTRFYLSDASFLVGLKGDREFLERIDQAIRNPHWPLCLGRKSYLPSVPIPAIKDGSVVDLDLQKALESVPITTRDWGRHRGMPDKIRYVVEANTREGSLRYDVPVAAFSQRKFGPRRVKPFFVTVGGVL